MTSEMLRQIPKETDGNGEKDEWGFLLPSL